MPSDVQFRASACGKYIVATVGGSPPHVMTIPEAEACRDDYRRAARASVLAVVAAYETSTANALQNAIDMAHPF